MCGGESQGRDLSRFFSSLSSNHVPNPYRTLPYLTLPYLTYATYATYATYRSEKEASQKNRFTQTATRRGQRGRWGDPTNRVLKVLWFLPSTWVRFSKKYDARFYLPVPVGTVPSTR